jgi:hypothetical protein
MLYLVPGFISDFFFSFLKEDKTKCYRTQSKGLKFNLRSFLNTNNASYRRGIKSHKTPVSLHLIVIFFIVSVIVNVVLLLLFSLLFSLLLTAVLG